MTPRWINWLWKANPVTRVVYARAQRGLKLIALGLIIVLISALPLIITVVFNLADPPPPILSWLFAVGALIAHIGFVLGLVLLIRDSYR